MLAVFLAVAAIGAGEDARNQRVLSFLDPIMAPARTAGWQSVVWLLARRTAAGWTVTALAAVIALAALVAGRLRAAPAVLLAAAVVLAVWGQVFLLSERAQLGALLYGCGIACAVVLGFWCPFHRLGGFPPLPSLQDGGVAAVRPQLRRMAWGWECVAVLCLVSTAVLMRVYALTELPQGIDLELIEFQILSRTPYGFSQYVKGGAVLTNGAGLFTQLTQMGLFQLFGTSFYTLRLTAVLWGVAAVGLLYWLVRRLAGVAPAMVATLLFMAGPEQLFWSRTENTHFAAIAVLALIAVHIGLWMVRRLSIAAAVAAALSMPFSRYFYTPGMVMFVYPLALYAHAVVFVRGAWRKAWYVVPVLAGGVVLWVFNLSIVYSYVNDWHWRFIHPAWVHGAPAWRKHGEGSFREASLLELSRLQAEVVASNLGEVVSGIAYHGPRMFSHFYQRGNALPNHLMAMNAGLVVMFALGLGYLLGQCHDRRAFALLIWVFIGLLPGVMSNEPSARRISLMFPAAYAIAGVTLAAAVRMVRDRCGRWVAWMTTAVLGVAVAGVVWTSLASHLAIPTGPIYFGAHVRFTKPLFEDSDLILHNLQPGLAKAVIFGNLDTFIDREPCFHYVENKEWSRAALDPACDFNEYAYRFILPPEGVQAVRQRHRQRRISYLFEDNAYSRTHIDLLHRLYPSVEVRRDHSAVDQRDLVSMTVETAGVAALHSPSLIVDASQGDVTRLGTELLRGVTLTTGGATDGEGTGNPPVIVRGGLLLECDGWYGFAVKPECAAAALAIDDQPASSPELRPMLAGIHPFEIALSSATACALPLQMQVRSHERPEPVPAGPTMFVSPAVAAVPQAQAAPVIAYPGYGQAKVFAQFTGGGIDLGADAQGRISVLVLQEGQWRVQRFDAAGREEARWYPEVLPGRNLQGMVIEPDGTSVLTSGTRIWLYDHDGHEIGAWNTPWEAVATDIALSPEGRILLAVPTRHSIAVFGRDGKLHGEIRAFDGGPGRLQQPTAVTVGPDGEMLVIQDDGVVLLLNSTDEPLKPAYVAGFQGNFSSAPVSTRGATFDAPGRILIPDTARAAPLVYDRQGTRMMAAAPERDLGRKGFGEVAQFQFAGDQLYVLERSGSRVWSIAR
jgi:hypothetical protein